MTNLTELADRVEALEGPCRGVDAEIVAIVKVGMRSPWFIAPPSFTGSLDAAMTLVPDGWGRCIEQERPSRDCEASLSHPGCEPWGQGSINAVGKTLALALCAAALRATGSKQ